MSTKKENGGGKRWLVKDVIPKGVIAFCGVKGIGGITAKRTTFLVDKEGVVRHIWEKVDVKGHAEDVLKKIRELDIR